MSSDVLVPLLILLLSLVLIALWFHLRARRQADRSSEAGPEQPPAEPAPEPAPAAEGFQGFPPEIEAVRAELARIRAEEEAGSETAARWSPSEPGDAAPDNREDAAQSETVEEIAAAEEDAPEEAVPETEDAADQPEPEDSAPAAETTAELDTPLQEEEPFAEPEPEPADAYDEEGRLILPMATGDVIVATEAPRRLRLTVTRQWPLAMVQGFSPETERLDVFYDGPDADDVVMLPTIDGTWQVNLGGRPVVQVECPDGPEALAAALRVNP